MKAKMLIVAVLMAAASIGTLSSTSTMTAYAQICIIDARTGECIPDDDFFCIIDPRTGECTTIDLLGFGGFGEGLGDSIENKIDKTIEGVRGLVEVLESCSEPPWCSDECCLLP